MGLSFLIHPVDVEIEQLDSEGTEKDPTRPGEVKTPDGSWGTGVQEARQSPLTLQGQWKKYKQREMLPGLGGDVPDGKGHVLFESSELEAAGVTLAVGDKFVRIAGVAVEFYVIDLIPTGTYGGVSHMLKAVYSDKPKGR